MGVTPDTILGELAGLRALARSLVHGDADAEDLLQETAIAALAHPPEEDRPVRPWLATVLRNRWRMDRRGRSRRSAREQAIALDDDNDQAVPDAIDRARILEKLSAALVALDEPFRTVVVRRYIDGESAADIARALGVPPGTIRWRLKTGLERLRAALDESTPRWQRALLPFTALKGAAVVKAKTTIISLVVLALLLGGGTLALLKLRGGGRPSTPAPVAMQGSAHGPVRPGIRVDQVGSDEGPTARPDPLPGQGRVIVEPIAAEGGAISGRVINWSTGEGVVGAELTFTSVAGATTIRSGKDGAFELAPPAAGTFSLATIIAPGFLPYAPELTHSPVRVALGVKQAVRGVTLFVFPALDYFGRVVDARGSPVAGAHVKLADPPAGEQTLEKIVTEWTTDKQGQFVFHAPDFSVFEATRGNQRGWAIVDGNVATTKKMTITIGDAPARDATIRGKTVDGQGAPVADVLVTAVPDDPPNKQAAPRSVAFATSGADGSFTLEGLDRGGYNLVGEVEDFAPTRQEDVKGGAQNVKLTLDVGLPLGGVVHDPDDKPIAAYTVLVTRRQGLVRDIVTTRTIMDPRGRFDVRVPKGSYEVLVSATGWAPSKPLPVDAGTTDAKITLGAGASLSGIVVDAQTNAPLAYARVQREGAGGGASASPANAGTVTRENGTFELTGIPAGPFTISIGAGDYNPRLEGGLVAADGGTLGPIKIALQKLADGETPKIELVGIGVKLSADGEMLRVDMVVPESGAASAGIAAGDHIVTVDGVPVTTLGLDGAVTRIRGLAHTTVAIGVQRGQQVVPLVVERKPLRV